MLSSIAAKPSRDCQLTNATDLSKKGYRISTRSVKYSSSHGFKDLQCLAYTHIVDHLPLRVLFSATIK